MSIVFIFLISIIYYSNLSISFTIFNEPLSSTNENSISKTSYPLVLQIPRPQVYFDRTMKSSTIISNNQRYVHTVKNFGTKSDTMNDALHMLLFVMMLPVREKMKHYELHLNQLTDLLLIPSIDSS